MIRNLSLWLQSVFYVFAGINHFIQPEFYEGLVPDYIPFDFATINNLSGIVEITLGLGLFMPSTRKWASIGIITMLIAFIPSHIWFIQIGSCVPSGLCVPDWVAWARLLLVHPILIGWAWMHR